MEIIWDDDSEGWITSGNFAGPICQVPTLVKIHGLHYSKHPLKIESEGHLVPAIRCSHESISDRRTPTALTFQDSNRIARMLFERPQVSRPTMKSSSSQKHSKAVKFEVFIKIYFYLLNRGPARWCRNKAMHDFVDIQTPTHDHTQRITHYCRRLSVVSPRNATSIASVNIRAHEPRKKAFCRPRIV